MTKEISVRFLSYELVEVSSPAGARRVQNLAELRSAIDAWTLTDPVSAYAFGILAAFFASRELTHAGMVISQSNVARVLDEYYFVLQNEDMDRELQKGIDEGTRKVKELSSNSRLGEVFQELDKLIQVPRK